jgi:signal peptidase I
VARRLLGALGLLPIPLAAVVVFHLIRTHLCERYLVPSSSMEPILHGDPVAGDIVAVDKTAFWRGAPRRWELVVLRNPDDREQNHLVKRVVGLPGEEIEIANGDVFAGRVGEPRRLVRKSVATGAGMRMTWFAFPDAAADLERGLKSSQDWRPERGGLRLDAGGATLRALGELLGETAQTQRRTGRGGGLSLYLPGHLSTAAPVNAGFIDTSGAEHPDPASVRDVGLELELVPDQGIAGLQLVLEEHDTYHAFVYAPDGATSLAIGGGEVLARGERGPPLRPGAPLSLSFGYLDGRLFLEAGGTVLLEHDLDLPAESPPERFPGPRFANLLHVGVAGASVGIARLRVFHDVHYDSGQGPLGRPQPQYVPEGHLWLVGDNSRYSRDSRDPRIGAYPASAVVGRPFAVIGPRSRMRWLPR